VAESRDLMERILGQAIEQTRDHQAIFADFASRFDSFAGELIPAWTRACSTIAPAGLGDQGEVARAFFAALKQGNLREAYASWFRWGCALVNGGFAYDQALKIVREEQRAVLPFILRVYADVPQLSSALEACDDVFDAVRMVVGAAYVDLAQRQSAANARLNILGQLTNGTAHALNNTISVIIGRSQLLLDHPSDYDLRGDLQDILTAAAHSARIVRRLQEYAQPDLGDERMGADVNMLLRDAAEITRFIWRDQAEINNVMIDVVKDFADVPIVNARPSELRHVFVTLILNAIEAMPQGGNITLRTERKENVVLASVIDSGAGVSDVARARIAEPFFTTKGIPHLGLGLSSAAKIIAEHDGTLSVESRLGQGTNVSVSLPISPRMEGKVVGKMPTKHPAKILVIDNEPSVRDLLGRLLKIHGHTVVAAGSGLEGIAAFKQDKFDLVLTDLGMPEMSGWDVAREIKKLNPQIPIALTTGWPVEMGEQELKERNIDRVVSKPFHMPTLLGMIDEALAGRS
jgi:signal transduction histidine kinase/CheY-like chemotaxis protein